MTPEERAMLTELADKIAQTPAPAYDPEADELIRNNIGKRPDALYILTQTALIQNLAIQHAQQEIQALKQRVAQPAPAPGASFLGGGAAAGGVRPGGAPGYSPSAAAPPPLPPQYAQPQYAPPQYAPPQYGAPPASGGPSFLRSAAQTAAGVAAGALAFEGIRSLFGGGFGGGGGFGLPHFGGSGEGGFLGGAPGGETIVNNYYDSPDASGRDVSGGSDVTDTSSDDSSQYAADTSAAAGDADASYEDASSDVDDSTVADDSYADAGGFDSGGSGGDDYV